MARKNFEDWYYQLCDEIESCADSLGANEAKKALIEAISNASGFDDEEAIDYDLLNKALAVEDDLSESKKLYSVVLDEDYSPLGHDEYLTGPVTLKEAKAFINKKSKARADYEFPKSSKTMREAAAEEYAKRYSIIEADD